MDQRVEELVDPTTVRLSEHFLLSDFIGCHSVYTKGYHNRVFDNGMHARKIEEGKVLATTVLEPMLKESPLSISYGIISLDLARKIVKYQSPDKPSYHQWNDGAACDVIVHKLDHQDIAPIHIARAVDEEFPISRLITYSESPYLCIATRKSEVKEGKPRKAFYESRYIGKGKKPLWQEVWQDRGNYFDRLRLRRDWRGAGYPTYHGGGIRQVQHIRVGRYAMLSDFLYSSYATMTGVKNCPTLDGNWLHKFTTAGRVYSDILDACKVHRMSIVRAYEAKAWSDSPEHHWDEEFTMFLVPPASADLGETVQLTRKIGKVPGVHHAALLPHDRIISVSGAFA